MGVETGDGWHDLLDQLCSALEAEMESSGCSPITVRQVKQKFGALRFYASGGNERCRTLIRQAEALSTSICDICARPGTLVSRDGWLRARCSVHEDTRC